MIHWFEIVIANSPHSPPIQAYWRGGRTTKGLPPTWGPKSGMDISRLHELYVHNPKPEVLDMAVTYWNIAVWRSPRYCPPPHRQRTNPLNPAPPP